MSSMTAEKMRAWRQTPSGKLNTKARHLASTAALKWFIANLPDLWADMLADARVQVGLPVELTPTGMFGKPIDHGSDHGARAHRYRNEPACDACIIAERAYNRDRMRARREATVHHLPGQERGVV